MKKILVCALSVLLVYNISFATVQIGDQIVYNNKTYALMSYPLERLFTTNVIKMPKVNEWDSSCHRGYVATWKINDEKLFLSQISFIGSDATLKSVFPNCNNEMVFAHWFSGFLVIATGEKTGYIGYLPMYSRYMLCKVISGEIRGIFELNQEEYLKCRVKQFEKYKETEEYRKLLKAYKNEDSFNVKDFDEFMFIFNTDFTTIIVEL